MAEEQAGQHFRNDDVKNTLLSNIDNGIIILNENLQILHFNKWLEIYTQHKENDVLHKKIDEVYPSINIKTLQRKIKTALTMNSPAFYTADTTKYLIPIKINQIQVTDFEHMRQDVRIVPCDIKQKIVAIIITDQTHMINTQNLLKQNIQRVEELNEETKQERKTIDERVNLIKIDENYLITDVSQSYLNLLHITKEDIVNKNMFELEKSNISDALKNNIIEHMHKKEIYKYEQVSLDGEGKEIWFYHTLVPDYDKSNNHNGFIIFGDNITDSKLVQLQQEKLLENSRSAAMGEMISMIAHQWRQPLSTINTIIAALKIKQELNLLDEELQSSSYDKIEETTNFLSETINDFSNFFKPNKELVDVSVSFIFEKSTSFIKQAIKKNDIHYTQEIEESIRINTYQNELIQAIMNILQNSIDAFKENNIENKTIEVSVFKNDKDINIQIMDNAGGISKENLAKVFEPYFSTKSKNGTGLGLYMCKTIIEEHLKGEITMQSLHNKTKTIINLPRNLQIQEIQ